MPSPLNAVIIGAAGRMGCALVRAACELRDQLAISGAIASTSSDSLGRDAGELAGVGRLDIAVTDDLAAALGRADFVIDFSQPHATGSNLAVCRAARKPLLIGTTGFAADLTSELDAAAKEIPLLVAPNTSIGVTLLTELTRMAARALPADFDIEIVEAHHRFKKDAPSGTADSLAAAILKATGKGRDALVYGRHGDEVTRERGKVGMHSLRVGDEVGRHTAYFAALGERLELTHVATNRDTFVHGALRAAKWLADQKPGRYTIDDVLGMS